MTDNEIASVSTRVEVVGGQQAIAVLKDYRATLTALGGKEVTLTVQDTQAKAALASLRAETAQMRAQTTAIKVTADTSVAGQQIRSLDAETRNLTARARVMKVEADTSQAMQTLRAYEAETRRIQALSNTSNAGNSSSTSLRGAATGLLGGGPLATAGIVAGGFAATEIADVTTASIDLNSKLQQANITFTTFLGSTEAADAHVQDLAKFAATTPFQFPDLIAASSKMQAMGFAARDVIPDLRAIGDAESALGNGKEGIDRVVLALGQMQLKGHVAGDELLQLTEAGVPALQYLATAYGKTTAEITKMVEAGQINGKAGASAILEGLAADPKFADQMAKQSASFAGSMSNIQDAANMAAAKGLRPLFDSANDAATALNKFTASDEFTKGAENFALALHDDIDAIKELASVGNDLKDNPVFALLAGAANTYNPARVLSGASEAITGNRGARTEADALAADKSDLDVAMERVKVNQRILDLQTESSRKILGVPNLIETAQRDREIQGLKTTRDEYDKILAKRQQIAYEAGKFIGPVDQRDPMTGISAEEQKQLDADAKTAADNIAAYQKQMYQDIAASAKQGAADVANAWKAAGTTVAGIDLARPFASLSAASAPLHTVIDDLSHLGQAAPASVTGLSRIADEFAAITDSEKAAGVAFGALMDQFSETDTRITKLQSLRKSFDDAAAASPMGSDLRGGRTAVDANIDAQIAKLRTGQASSLLEAVKVVPDFATFDDQMRQKTIQEGGAAKVSLTVNALTEKARADIHAIEINPWSTNMTVHLQYVTPDGKAIDPSQIDNPGGVVSGNPYYRTPLAASDPHSSANIDNPGGGGVAGTGVGSGGASGGMIRYEDYQRVLSQYPGSPINNRGSLDTLNAVAQQMGVDPRTLMAIMQTESGYGANAGLIGKQFNYGGMGVNDRGYGHDSGIHATDGGPEYAGYNDFKSFLMDISAWAKQHQGDFSTYQTADAGQGKNSAIVQLRAQVPLTSDVGGGGSDAAATINGGARDRIVQQAIQSIGQDKLVNYCQQFIEETLQTAIGNRGPTPFAATATDAFNKASGMGLETHNPQKGDLVYYPSAANGTGHVAIYMGDGQQISTYDGRPGVNGDQYAVHSESVAPGARYISVGQPDASTSLPHGATYGQSERGQAAGVTPVGGTLNLSDPTTPEAQRAAMQQKADADDLATSLANITTAGKQVNEQFAKMGAADMGAAIQQFRALQPILEKMALAKLPEGASDADKQIATNAALGQTLELTATWGQALSDIRNKTGNLAADEAKINSIVSGPLAAGLTRELDIMNDQAAIAERIAQLTQRKTDLETAHNQTLQDRQTADTAESRAQTRQGWADQAVDRRLAARQEAETHANTVAMRGFEDRQRALTQYGTLQKRQLQDQLTGLEKANSLAISGFAAQKQILSARAFAGDASASMQLAIGGDAAKNAADAFTTQKQAINDAITAEDKLASQQQYDLETQRLAESRASEDRLQALADEGIRNQTNRAARDEAHTIEQWQIEDTRAREDVRYNLAITSIDKEIAAQQTLATAADANLKAAQDALSFWQQTGIAVQQATAFLNALTQVTGGAAFASPETFLRRLGGMR